jgi:hypothetical protein
MMNAVPGRLPIGIVIRRSFLFAWESRAVLMMPLLIYIGLTMLADLAVGLAVGANDQGNLFFVSVAEQVLGAAFAVGIHRFVLLAEAPGGFRFFRWDRNFVQYVVIALLLLVMSLSVLVMGAGFTGGDPAAQSSATGGVAALVSLVFLFFVAPAFARLVLALPSAALGDHVGVRRIWQATEGNGFRLMAAALLVLLPFLAIDTVLLAEAMTAGDGGKFLILALGKGVAAVQMTVWSIMLSLCYDLLVRGGGPAAH